MMAEAARVGLSGLGDLPFREPVPLLLPQSLAAVESALTEDRALFESFSAGGE
jgi:hypothetical protein